MNGPFGHHPDPVQDYCTEVTHIIADLADFVLRRQAPPFEDIARRIRAACSFRAGGRLAAVDARRRLHIACGEMLKVGWPTHREIKTGTLYREIARGKDPFENDVVIFRNVFTGTWHTRMATGFKMRFEEIQGAS